MGLLFSDEGNVNLRLKQETDILHRLECKACPLRTQPGRMEPTGSTSPGVYILGEAPGADEIKEGKQFIGESGQLLRPRIPKWWLQHIRWNNVCRSRPPRNRTPERQEIEACRPSIIRDIERTRPEAIFGFGNVPLSWVSGFSGITLWRGRKMPVRVGTHKCWYYPFLHPAFILQMRRGYDLDDTDIGSEDERIFVLDLARAFKEVEAGLPKPDPHDAQRALEGVETILIGGGKGVELIAEALEWAGKQKIVGLDYETNSLRPYSAGAKILSAAVSNGSRSIAFPFDHRSAQFSKAERLAIDGYWCKFLESSAIKVVHMLAFEMEWTGVKFGQELLRASDWEDTASAASVLDERKGKGKPGCFSLEFLVQQYYGFNLKKVSGVDRKDLDRTPLPKVLTYNAMDAKYHLGLWQKQEVELEREGLMNVYDLSLRRVPTVVLTQMKGVPIDQNVVVKLQKKYKKRIEETEEAIASQSIVHKFKREKGHDYNPASYPDNLYLFWEMLKRTECRVVDKFTKKTKLSFDEEVLSKIDHPLAQLLVKSRKAVRQKSTYIDPLAVGSDILYPDGLLHTIFNTIFATTGRTSSESPNLQNFPKREDEAKEVRSAIAALAGKTILAFDYGQIEARMIAAATKDKAFCKALWENYDVHMDWAERIAHAYPARIGGKKMLKDKKAMKDFRTDIKNEWTFPLFFGAKLESAAGYLNIPANVLRPHYYEFWKEYEGVYSWQQEQVKFYNKYGYVECLTGRRRHGPMSVNMIYNSPIQGTAAEIIMDTMCRLSELGDDELQPELTIHDDLTFLRVDENRAEEIAEKIITAMLDVPFDFINVPITVELSSGPNWADLTEIGTFSSATWFK